MSVKYIAFKIEFPLSRDKAAAEVFDKYEVSVKSICSALHCRQMARVGNPRFVNVRRSSTAFN